MRYLVKTSTFNLSDNALFVVYDLEEKKKFTMTKAEIRDAILYDNMRFVNAKLDKGKLVCVEKSKINKSVLLQVREIEEKSNR